MNREDIKVYTNKLQKMNLKQSELFDRLNGKRDAYNYTMGKELYVVGVHYRSHRPVVKLCDVRSKELYEKSIISLKDLEKDYSNENHRTFLSNYNMLCIYNRQFLSQYDELLIDKILQMDDIEIEEFTQQVYEYQLMFYHYIYGN